VERKVVVITGPTGSGKTDLSILAARKINTEIISADSRQFYKLMDIGTAKPGSKELKKVPHHFISFLNPDEDYNVSKFRNDALKVCKSLWKSGKIPLITGGSGLYIKALIDGISDTPEPDLILRENLLKEKRIYGQDYLYKKLLSVDPESASLMLPQNWKRVIRALEVYHLTGKSIRQFHREQNIPELNAMQYGINWDRKVLYHRIDKRVDKMISDGLVDEVKSIIDKGYSKKLNALNSVGYREIYSYLEGEYSLETAVELVKRNSRRYAKRQMTWFRRDERIKWLTINSYEDFHIFAEKIAGDILKDSNSEK
jgi:tRNA dimethylallyltransferase